MQVIIEFESQLKSQAWNHGHKMRYSNMLKLCGMGLMTLRRTVERELGRCGLQPVEMQSHAKTMRAQGQENIKVISEWEWEAERLAQSNEENECESWIVIVGPFVMEKRSEAWEKWSCIQWIDWDQWLKTHVVRVDCEQKRIEVKWKRRHWKQNSFDEVMILFEEWLEEVWSEENFGTQFFVAEEE